MAAGALGLALSAVQTLPIIETISTSVRVSEVGANDIYEYDIEPQQALGAFWPNVHGSFVHGERYWLQLVAPAWEHRNWVPSLYMGALIIVLASSGFGVRSGPPWRAWLTAIALVTALGALGKFTSPFYWLNAHGSTNELTSTSVANAAGLPGDGSVYWLLATVLPGFGTFRFPGKLVSFTALAVAILAGYGWDRIAKHPDRRVVVLGLLFLGLSVGGLAIPRSRMLTWLGSFASQTSSLYGPINLSGCINEIRAALWHGALGAGGALGVILAVRRWPTLAGVLALGVVTVDLAFAGLPLVKTMPQAAFETPSKAAEAIRAAEKENPAGGPFRIYCMPLWAPTGWSEHSSPIRFDEWVTWERDVLQPKFAITEGLSYAFASQGNTESYDFWLFFRRFPIVLDDAAAATIGGTPGDRILYYPRRGFDLWNTRYFIVPANAGEWKSPTRSYASFLDQSEMIYPAPSLFAGPDGPQKRRQWLEQHDVQIRRNNAVFPRAWIVHEARFVKPIQGLREEDRRSMMGRLLLQNDPLWHDQNRTIFDVRRSAIIETDDARALAPYVRGGAGGAAASPDAQEAVKITRYEPQRVELDARLDHPGIVVLADAFDSGWQLEIDGKPTTILRANRMMRGAAVPAGSHTLVYRYEPLSFRAGAAVSLVALLLLGGGCFWARERPSSDRGVPKMPDRLRLRLGLPPHPDPQS
jgi:hypothetical protein